MIQKGLDPTIQLENLEFAVITNMKWLEHFLNEWYARSGIKVIVVEDLAYILKSIFFLF